MSEQVFDVIVVGGGPGGYVAAIRAAQLGLATALVERDELGGVCLNWGCIPTKALLHTADVLRDIQGAAALGIDTGPARIDLQRIVARSRGVAQQLNRGVTGLLKKNKVTVIKGSARLSGPGRVVVDGAQPVTLAADAIVIATGARPKALPGIEPDGEIVWTSREAMVPDALPKRLLVIGAGAIGVEFASFYRTLGSAVTLVEVLPQILPVEDTEIAALARKSFEAAGIEVHTETSIDALRRTQDGLTVTLKSTNGSREPTEAGFDRAILAVGVTGNVENLGLEHTRVATERGFIRTNDQSETDEPGIYAIGDVAGPPCLAHKASHEAVACIEHIAGLDSHPLDRMRIAGCTYSHPQVASIGLTERAAAAAGRSVRIGRFPLIGNGKAIAIGDANGLVKTLFDAATGELLGAHLVGPGVTELIQGFAIAMGAETTEAELIATVFPHPTISEAMHESVLAAYGRAIHI
jgi:dihydrolipoamide dehydrogenase